MIFLHNSSCCCSPQWADVRCMNQAARHRALATWSHLIQTAVGWNSPVCYITKAVGWWEFLLQCCSVGAEIGQSLQQLRPLWPCSKATAALSIHYWALSALNRDKGQRRAHSGTAEETRCAGRGFSPGQNETTWDWRQRRLLFTA